MKRLLVCVLVLTLSLAAVGCNGSTASSSDSSSSASTSSSSASSETEEEEPIDYSTGIHHAEMIIEGYQDQPITIEIYADSAPRTAETFCNLVNEQYYNGKTMFWILNGMYVRCGNVEQDNNYLIRGEYEESDISNSNTLKRGYIALSRAKDGQQSDASSFIIFLSDMSYLDGKYAGFGKITQGIDVILDIASKATVGDEAAEITIDESGQVTDPAKCPVITSITMVDEDD